MRDDALAFLIAARDVKGFAPSDDRGQWPPSNSQLRRWLDNGSVLINGARPKPTDAIEFPIREFVYFPRKKRQNTCVGRWDAKPYFTGGSP